MTSLGLLLVVLMPMLLAFRNQQTAVYRGKTFLQLIRSNPVENAPRFSAGHPVNVTVRSFSTMGATVEIHGRGHQLALISQKEIDLFRGLQGKPCDVKIGDQLSGHIQHIRKDSKMYVQLRPKSENRIPLLMEKLLQMFKEFPDDILPVGDKSSAGDIMYFLKMTRKDFKMVVGGLFKAGMVEPGKFETKLLRK